MRRYLQKIIGYRRAVAMTSGDWLKFIGPGLIVTVGFIDPGNWATNVAAGAEYGLSLLWVITLSTIMLIMLQHNAAHLGIVTGDCLAEAATRHLRPATSRFVLGSAMFACIATAFAEILGGAIALQMLFGFSLRAGSVIMFGVTSVMLYAQAYRRLEKWIIGFVSLIGLSFIYELCLVAVDWPKAALSAVQPNIPQGGMLLIMSLIGAVVMPHNIFLHSEVIQSRKWNLSDESTKQRQLRFEFLDTLFSMGVGWAINCAMIVMAATTFFKQGLIVTELGQAHSLLIPLIGKAAGIVFAVALLMAGIASSVTSGMAGGSVMSGWYGEPYDIGDRHTRLGILLTTLPAAAMIWLITEPFKGLLYSQALLSLQLPITVFLLIYLTSSEKVMGTYKNAGMNRWVLPGIAVFITGLNIFLLQGMF